MKNEVSSNLVLRYTIIQNGIQISRERESKVYYNLSNAIKNDLKFNIYPNSNKQNS